MAKGRAGVQGRVALRQSLLGLSKSVLKKTKDTTADDALIAAIIAKNTGQNVIATVPSSLSPGKVGRIWTGAMYGDFDADVTQVGNKTIIKIGWLKRKQKYYVVQEEGGTAFGRDIVPMHAIAQAGVAAQDYLSSKGIK